MGLSDAQKKERSEYLEKHLIITECSQRKPYVFISYASDNWEAVFKDAVVPMQKKHGLSVYADKAFDKVNDKWIVPMLRNIRGADAVVAFVSQNYIESYACFLELLTAVNNKKPIVFVSLADSLHLGNTTDQPDVERGVKNEILNQGANIATNTNNTSNDIMRAMKSAYTSISTLLEQDALAKYDISDAFINFFRDASINRKTIHDLNAVRGTIWSVSRYVFDEHLIAEPEPVPQVKPTPAPKMEPASVPVPQAEPVPVSAAQAEPAPAPQTEPAPVPVPQAEPVPVSAAQAEPVPVPQTEPTSVPISQAEPVPVPAAQAEPIPVPQTEPAPAPVPVTPPEPVPAPQAEPAPVPRAEPVSEIPPVPVSQTQPQQEAVKPGSKKILIGAAAAVVLIIVIAALGGKKADREPANTSVKAEIAEADDAIVKDEPVEPAVEDEEPAAVVTDMFYLLEFDMSAYMGSYTGEWDEENQRPQGQGVMRFNVMAGFSYAGYRGGSTISDYDGELVYEGEWKDGLQNGYGTLTMDSERLSYAGEWKDGLMHGQGKFTWSNGTSYEVEMRDGLEYGEGIFTWPEGSTEVLMKVSDMPYGEDSYSGFWDAAKQCPQGPGIMNYKNGGFCSAIWEEGNTYAMNGDASIFFANGDYYCGPVENGKMHGRGTYTEKGGESYEGVWEDGVRIE